MPKINKIIIHNFIVRILTSFILIKEVRKRVRNILVTGHEV